MIKVAKLVKELLENHKDLRDDDERLICQVWWTQASSVLKGRDDNRGDYVFISFLRDYSKGQFHKAESIKRSRQKLQELHPGLRGKSYKARQKHTVKVKADLRDESKWP